MRVHRLLIMTMMYCWPYDTQLFTSLDSDFIFFSKDMS